MTKNYIRYQFLHLHECMDFFDTTSRSTKTGPAAAPTRKFFELVKPNLPVLEFLQYDHQKYKNRKPDRKPDPGSTRNFYGLIGMSIQFTFIEFFFDRTNRYKDID